MDSNYSQQQFQRQQGANRAGPSGEIDMKALAERLKLPGYGLMITATLSLAVAIGGGIWVIAWTSGPEAATSKTALADAIYGESALNAETLEYFSASRIAEARKKRDGELKIVNAIMLGGEAILILFLASIYMWVLVGGFMLLNMRKYTLCRFACLIAVIPVFSPLLVAGMPFGIIALFRLTERRYKKAFGQV